MASRPLGEGVVYVFVKTVLSLRTIKYMTMGGTIVRNSVKLLINDPLSLAWFLLSLILTSSFDEPGLASRDPFSSVCELWLNWKNNLKNSNHHLVH